MACAWCGAVTRDSLSVETNIIMINSLSLRCLDVYPDDVYPEMEMSSYSRGAYVLCMYCTYVDPSGWRAARGLRYVHTYLSGESETHGGFGVR